ncbi:MAG: helix-turn-helix domain-containing protein [Halopseudomonas sp.]|uniref:helix-turn-helix transcriptional regulator n=1 Tax=Halopseudomonas sp. TaxID=2901191 RepID=UPI0030017CF7
MASEQLWLSPAVHPVYVRLVYAELLRQGLSAEQIQAGSSFDWHALHDNHFLSLGSLHNLLLRALALSARPWLGFAVGLHTDVSAHGPAGYAAVCASNIGAAIDITERYASLRQHLAHFRLEPGEAPILTLQELRVPTAVREYLLGHFTTGMLRLLETLGGQPLNEQIRIDWPLPEPSWSEQLQDYAREWRFNAPGLRIHLPAGLLQQPCLGADPQACRQALRDCANQLEQQQRGGSLTERIKQRLLQCEEGYPTLAGIAALEHVTPRTLLRHLRSEGSRYQQILDSLRGEQAAWLLSHTELSIERVAERLGYQDTSNFSRTFRRWHGCTPRAYRRQSR